MSEQSGEKTEQATPKRLEEAYKKGQIPRSTEVQTVFVLSAAMLAFFFTGREMWGYLVMSMSGVLQHLHEIPVSLDAMQGYFLTGMLTIARCLWPIMLAAIIGGLLAGGIQTRFRAASEALEPKWDRLNPATGLKQKFSARALVPSLLAMVKLVTIVILSYGVVRSIARDPIFYTPISTARIAEFMADSTWKIMLRVIAILFLIAILDYAYQVWRQKKELMMTKQEVKDEMKNTEGNPHVKTKQRQRQRSITFRKMLSEVPQADVVVTNPTHLAVALKYDRETMSAPRVVAKGARLKAWRIRELAQRHQVPVLEQKPLARLLYKQARVGGEIPAQLYAAVAEVLAWVYRINRYKYYLR